MALIKFMMILIVLLVGPVSLTLAKKPHLITFRSPNLYPEGIAWDPSAQHFLVGSINNRTIKSVSDAGVVETLISDDDLPENVTVLGLSVDSVNNRLLAVINAVEPLPEFNALAAYDLRERRPVDFKGNAYVTNAAGNFIWKVNEKGEPSIFSRSKAFTAHPVDRDSPYSYCGLNGIAYVSKGYLLVVQSNTGKMFKVDEDDGTARLVLLNKDLILADGIAVRSDGVVLVVSHYKLWFLKSQDSWGEGVVFDEIDLDVEGFPTSVAVGAEDRVYVINGHVLEAMKGNFGREMFSIEEVRSGKESEDENIWVFALLGLGFAYLLFWRFQMRSLVKNMDKKTN
uniref:SMP-30/Gluconolactonase/LRE-like region domain-containing protein n=1 Tax=Fagus sylvatica TaxID=28930 RepID=A0A2N9FNI9_FAGSY